MNYYLSKYFQGTASYDAWQNKMRLVAWERKLCLYEAGLYEPFKINAGNCK